MTMRDPRFVFGSIGLFAAPILVVKFAAFWAGAGSPATASANNVESNPVAEHVASNVLQTDTAEQVEACERAIALQAIEHINSPLLYARETGPAVTITDDGSVVELLEVPEVSVQGLMGGSSPKAVIDGALYSPGDALADAPTWTVLEIDITLRQVILFEQESDRSITVKVNDRP